MNATLLPELDELYTSRALYNAIDFSDFEQEDMINYIDRVRKAEEPIDAYCIKCREMRTFKGNQVRLSTTLLDGEDYINKDIFCIELLCTRDSQHRLFSFFQVEGKSLIKIGQHPSTADLNLSKTSQYRKILGNEKYKEFVRAVGLKAHGVGIGAFVYLRRIFENLLEEAHAEARDQQNWDEDDYLRSKVDQKILILKEHLPSFLVENRVLYAILSKGIHSLDEDECLKYFDVIQVGIELILDEEIEQQKKRDKIVQARQAIQQIHQQVQKD